MYPLDLDGEEGKYRPIVGNDRCLGLREKSPGTVKEWLESQEVETYMEMERLFLGVMPSDFVPGKNLGVGLGKILFLAYDLDRFAEMLAEKKFRSVYEIDDALIRKVEENDEELLKLAFLYIRSQLEELMQISD
jgi:hypothetical protein